MTFLFSVLYLKFKQETKLGGVANSILELGLHFTYPINRFIGGFISYAFFITMIGIASLLDLQDTDKGYNINSTNSRIELPGGIRNRFDSRSLALSLNETKKFLADLQGYEENLKSSIADFEKNHTIPIINPNDYTLTSFDIIVIVMTIGFLSNSLWTILKYMFNSFISNQKYTITEPFWTLINLFSLLCILVSMIAKTIVTVTIEEDTVKTAPPLAHLEVVYCFLGLGVVLSIIRMFYFCSVQQNLGPIVLILKRIGKVLKSL